MILVWDLDIGIWEMPENCMDIFVNERRFQLQLSG